MLNPGRMLIRAFVGAANADQDTTRLVDCIPPGPSPHAAYIPNVVMYTHQGQAARFYDDLIRQKIVLINCMSTRDKSSCSSNETLVRVQALIGKELGHSIFMYSVTTDPEHDTPAILREFAKKCGAKDGWLFLSGDSANLKIVRQRLFTYGGGQDCSMHLIRYGNEAVGLWGGVMAMTTPEAIAQRLSWITPEERPSGQPKRGGPPPLVVEA